MVDEGFEEAVIGYINIVSNQSNAQDTIVWNHLPEKQHRAAEWTSDLSKMQSRD